jgi:transcriptional regulator with GAF, ATPase, and Fis domain
LHGARGVALLCVNGVDFEGGLRMELYGQLSKSLKELRGRLHYVNRAWSADNYESQLRFYAHIVPKMLDAEHCHIYAVDPPSGRLRLQVGTGIAPGKTWEPPEDGPVKSAVSKIEPVIGDCARCLEPCEGRRSSGIRGVACAPIRSVSGGRVTGAIEVVGRASGAPFQQEDAQLLQQVADYLSTAVDNILLHDEIARLSAEVDQEVGTFQTAYLGPLPFIADSEAMRNVLDLVKMVAANPVNVVIQGENGTGKEVIARMIHELRHRRARPFVAVNCAAIPETLMESEFFGYEKGAFTGATAARKGKFEEADGGTLFLDEITDMPLGMQPKFLRAIQEGEAPLLGGNRVARFDCSFISATNKDLRHAVSQNRFRQDLFYRLFAVELVVPPLRERPEDIIPLALAFLDDVCHRFNKVVGGFSKEVLALLESSLWPGNVRQLRHEVERLVALTPEGETLTSDRCSPEILGGRQSRGQSAGSSLSLPARVRDLEMGLIEQALEKTKGNKVRAARMLGITRQGLHKKLARYWPDKAA